MNFSQEEPAVVFENGRNNKVIDEADIFVFEFVYVDERENLIVRVDVVPHVRGPNYRHPNQALFAEENERSLGAVRLEGRNDRSQEPSRVHDVLDEILDREQIFDGPRAHLHGALKRQPMQHVQLVRKIRIGLWGDPNEILQQPGIKNARGTRQDTVVAFRETFESGFDQRTKR